MERDAAIALVRDLLTSATRHDTARLLELYADDAVVISPLFGEVRGSTAIAETWRSLFTGLADFKADVGHVLVDGDRIAVLAEVAATDAIGWFGLSPTFGPIRYKLVLLFTVKDGRVIRDERLYDSAGIIERLEKVRLDKELRTAAAVQRMLLSRTHHRTPFSESVGDSVACRAIGGDFFEILESANGDIGLALGDVAGKGPAAALLASMLQGMLATEVRSADGPAAILTRMNRGLAARNIESRFATIVYAVLSPGGRLVYSNAGHNAPALITRTGVHRLTTGGPILGAFPEIAFEEATVQLHASDTLVMFTDGVTEARNVSSDEFGEARLLASISTDCGAAPRDLLRRIFDDVRAFCRDTEQADDITVTVTRFAGAS
ncbi:MAG TPA: SpoIIE family protein phosphatase [Vicinamibacterales bacterium]|nr:SpoIIE family protein phosphatase [Vicinamibacterales bacterium]